MVWQVRISRSPLSLAKLVLVGVGTVMLLWFVVAQGVAAVVARGTNPVALALFDPGRHPVAGARLAQIQLQSAQLDEAIRVAEAAALRRPMDVRAMRVLGLSMQGAGDPRAAAVMRIAEQLSRRDTPTSLWVLEDAARRGELSRAMTQIDVLARRQAQPELIGRLFYAGLGDAPSRRAFADLLGSNPPWRAGFFASTRVALPAESFGQMEALFDELARTPAPPTVAERMTLIDRMVDMGAGASARDYWRRSFRVASGAGESQPFDPTFQAVAARPAGRTTSPFEWRIGLDADPFIEFRGQGGNTLFIVNPGADNRTTLISQVLTLPPGDHSIVSVIAEGAPRQAAAGWQVLCSPTGEPLIRSFAQAGNELSGVTVTVPPRGCAVQTLVLSAIERFAAVPVALRSVTIR